MEMNLFPNFANTEQAVDHVRDNFQWALREPSSPAPGSQAHDSHIPEIVQVIFYAMVVDDAAKLGLSRPTHNELYDVGHAEAGLWPVESWLIDLDRRLRRAQASQRANLLVGATPQHSLTGEGCPPFPPSETPHMRRNTSETTSSGP